MTFRPEIDWKHVDVILIMIAGGKTNRFFALTLPGSPVSFSIYCLLNDQNRLRQIFKHVWFQNPPLRL
jgi:hypothetical protein